MWAVEYAMKTIVWTRINQCVFGEVKTNTFENVLVWRLISGGLISGGLISEGLVTGGLISGWLLSLKAFDDGGFSDFSALID